MIDHLTLRVPSLDEAERFHGVSFGTLGIAAEAVVEDEFAEWGGVFSVARAGPDRPPTVGLHVGFRAPSRAHVARWWHAMTEAGYVSDGPPVTRPAYAPSYYGAFLLDSAGNSFESMIDETSGPGFLDHIWLRVRSLERATRFYETVCPLVGHDVVRSSERTQIRSKDALLMLVEGEPTQNVHLAFTAADAATVSAFHDVALAAGYRSNGEPAERPQYHRGYFGSYLLDPDGNNIEAVFHDR